jgi:crotonobetainyl-CoA:carnitine CoA-transferase CaiB-like acyl-CoA transferase
LSVAPIEAKFYHGLMEKLGIEPAELGEQMDSENWVSAKHQLGAVFKTRTRDEWTALLAESDACVAPVLDWREAAEHPHLKARRTLIDVAGVMQPAPAPRFSCTVPDNPSPPMPVNSQNTLLALGEWCDEDKLEALKRAGIID